MYDYLIVGSGLYGATFAYLAKKSGKKCLVIDKRSHSGGNVFCEDVHGIQLHKYGCHIFHTSNEKVWKFVNSFAKFNNYVHCPVANYKGKIYNLPFNMNTFSKLWNISLPQEAKRIIEKQISKITCEPRNLEEQAISLVGKDVYEKLIKGYTEKQWGRKCSELPASIIKRLPVRYTYDNNYFNDKYSGIPLGGYNQIIERLLEGIDVELNTNFFSKYSDGRWKSVAEKLVYTGKIDEYFNYQFGKLSYRTVRFEHQILEGISNFQGVSVMNYTDSKTPFTRVIEHKHFEPESDAYDKDFTIISKEYSEEWTEDKEAFYPVNDSENENLYNLYKSLSKKEQNVIFGGRLAEYKYYDMDDVIEKAMVDFSMQV